MSFVIAVILMAFEKVINIIFFPVLKGMISKDRDDIELLNKRAKKAATNIYKFIYYTCITYFGY
jgi:hypothetical protein